MTAILLAPDGPVEWAMGAAAERGCVVFATDRGLPASGAVAVYSAADAYGWPGSLVATCPATLRLMTALPRRGPRELWLRGAEGLGEGWAFADLRAALAAVRVVLPDEESAGQFRRTWGLPASVGR